MREDRSKAKGFQDWETPPNLFKQLHKEFKFTIDLAASSKTALVKRFFADALNKSWDKETGYVNPPFGLTKQFIEKASDSKGTVVALVLASVDTKWWYEALATADEIRFIRGRIRFYRDGKIPRVGPKKRKSSLRAGACIIIWKKGRRKGNPKIVWGYTWNGRE